MIESRYELLRLIAELSDADPELRLGQMLANLSMLVEGPHSQEIWDCEDDEFIQAANRLLTRLKERRAAIDQIHMITGST